MFTFNSRTGEFKHDNLSLGFGYAGNGAGKNNPDMERVKGHGPLPRGLYKIGAPYDDAHLGPVVFHLDPEPGTEMFGRSLMRIHGDSAAHPGDASDGCIILGLKLRRLVMASSDRQLTVL